MTAYGMEQWQSDVIAVHLATLDQLARRDFAEIRAAHDRGDSPAAIRVMVETQRQIAQAGTAAQGVSEACADLALNEAIHSAITAAQDHLHGVMASMGYRFGLVEEASAQ